MIAISSDACSPAADVVAALCWLATLSPTAGHASSASPIAALMVMISSPHQLWTASSLVLRTIGPPSSLLPLADGQLRAGIGGPAPNTAEHYREARLRVTARTFWINPQATARLVNVSQKHNDARAGRRPLALTGPAGGYTSRYRHVLRAAQAGDPLGLCTLRGGLRPRVMETSPPSPGDCGLVSL